jgi:muramoyltetrapeptide carboxypeptidase LdcA involved in peptidoglycan recycling
MVEARIRFPPPLGPGAHITVTAPSSPVPPALERRLDLVVGELNARGWVVRESRVRESEPVPRADRLDAWMAALLDDGCDAVLPPWGGDEAIELLEGMDFARLSTVRPKWILGYSDVSTLLLPLLLRAGWASAHGPNLMDLVPAQRDPLSARTLDWLSGAQPLTQHASSHFQTAFVDWARHPGAAFQLDQPTHVATLDGRALRARGRLIGGCIDTLMSLVGTPFGDVPAFLRAHRDDGVIVFLENCDLHPQALLRALMHLRLAGWFDGASAVLVGRTQAKETSAQAQASLLRRVLGATGIPVAHGLDIGHQPPQWTLVQGALASVEIDDGEAVIHQALR